ncbi:MAG: trypsin-like peptidase domain-containing protein [Candidatus Margulisbacteria bacterium]|nr:trypsin-like peptidase domain-containing protein [Candidatus Margulisiibacteriota bacterium]MBU1616783.1 trypsin-like peptidase domain-containing protein [Candidatus Margulisiibacteriota bacterium]
MTRKLANFLVFSLFCAAVAFAQSSPIDQGTIADIVQNEGDAVVNIDIIKNVRIRTSPFFNTNDFFGVMPEFRSFSRERIIPQRGAGSGFIIDKRGYIMTNEHVVRGAAEIIVTARNGKKYNGKIAGADPDLDIAIVKIDPQGAELPILPLGDSASLRPGEWVIAIGNPYGFSNSVTAGIISATGRVLGDLGKKNLIQIDAAINPGNSGGPLLNLSGEVIGVNVAIVSGAQGIGFAIPVNAANEIVQALIDNGRVIRGWLGVYMQDVDGRVANYLDLPMLDGAVILDIINGSPAQTMGLRKFDVFREVNGVKVSTANDMHEAIAALNPGAEIKVKVYRDGRVIYLTGKIAEKP